MKTRRKIVVAITGASGALYARLLLGELIEQESIEEIALIVSDAGEQVLEYERERDAIRGIVKREGRIVVYTNDNLFAPVASGSAQYDSMVIIPCTMGTVGRVASGVSSDLIGRAADVMLKERRQLIMAVRESPLSLIHLRNLTALAESGATIIPLSPSFYSHPCAIEELCGTIVERIIAQLGFDSEGYRWGEKETLSEL